MTEKRLALTSREKFQWFMVLLCFFLSGAAGLIYEVCWIRSTSLAFGSTTFALSSVLGIFFLGLAIGSHCAGRFAQRSKRPLLCYGVLEIVLSVLVLLTPWLFGWVENIFGVVYRATASSTAHFTVRLLLIAVVILPPTIIMGATFPLFCRFLVRSNRRIAAGIAVVYSVNTLGAAAGCALTGFWLLPMIGTQLALATGCGISFGCGVMMFLLPVARQEIAVDSEKSFDQASIDIDVHSATQSRKHWSAMGLISVLFFLVGFSALGMEIVWARYLSLLVHNSVYTYTITLSVTLLGIVVGSLLVSRFHGSHATQARYFGALQIMLALSVVGLMMTPPDIWMQLDQKALLYGMLLFFPAVLSGASYPLAICMAIHDVKDVASTSGTMAAFNTLGGIVGSMFVGFVALPQLGLQNSLLLVTGMSLTIGVTTWLLLDHARIVYRLAAIAVAIAVWISIPLATRVRIPHDYLARYGDVADFVEGYGANISVIKTGGKKILRIDGHWQGSSIKNHQIMAAHIPMQLLDHPKSVAVVGIGPGQTASRFLMYDIDHLSCVDIEPRLFEVVEEHFASDWMNDPRTNLLKEDGRNFLKHTDRKFDLISIELGQVFRPGVATFYTRDFYEEISSRLTEEGIVSQFVPISYFSPQNFRSVILTFQTVFPEATLWYNSSELLLIGRKNGPIKLDPSRFADGRIPAEVLTDLAFSHWGGSEVWLNQFEMFAGCFLMGPEELSLLKTRETNYLRDDIPALDYAVSAMKLGGHTEYDIENAELVNANLSPISTILDYPASNEDPSPQQLERMRFQRKLNIADIQISFLLRRVSRMREQGEIDKIVELAAALLQQSPGHLQTNLILANALMEKDDPLAAERYFRVAATGDDRNFHAVRGLASSLLRLGRKQEAIAHFERAIELQPNDFLSIKGLANSLHGAGRITEALAYYSQAIEMDPGFADLRNDYGIALAVLQRFAEAKEQFAAAYQLDPNHPNAQRNLETCLRDLQEASQ